MIEPVEALPPADSLARSRVTSGPEAATVFLVPKSWPAEEFDEYLRALMREAGIPDFAELSRLSGINQTQFSNWQRALSQPSKNSLKKIAPFLKTAPVSLYIKAGLFDDAELDLPATPDLSVLPREFTELLELYRDESLTDEQREGLRTALAIVIAGVRNQLPAAKTRKAR